MNPFDEPVDSNPFGREHKPVTNNLVKVNSVGTSNPFGGGPSNQTVLNYPYNTMVISFENNSDRISFRKGVELLVLFGFGNEVCVEALTQTLDLTKALGVLTSKVRDHVSKDPVGSVSYALWKAPFAARVGN